jgi:hypothetical protein
MLLHCLKMPVMLLLWLLLMWRGRTVPASVVRMRHSRMMRCIIRSVVGMLLRMGRVRRILRLLLWINRAVLWMLLLMLFSIPRVHLMRRYHLLLVRIRRWQQLLVLQMLRLYWRPVLLLLLLRELYGLLLLLLRRRGVQGLLHWRMVRWRRRRRVGIVVVGVGASMRNSMAMGRRILVRWISWIMWRTSKWRPARQLLLLLLIPMLLL